MYFFKIPILEGLWLEVHIIVPTQLIIYFLN